MKKYLLLLISVVVIALTAVPDNYSNYYLGLKKYYNQQFDLKLTEKEIAESDFTPVECFVDWRFFEKIPVYDNENKIIGYIQNDSIEENFAQVLILKKNADKFYVKSYLAFNENQFVEGWISKTSSHLSIFTSRDNIRIYAEPHNKDVTVAIIPTSYYNLLNIIDKNGYWIKVEVDIDGIMYRGWLPYYNLCPNPYSTCS